MVEFEENDFFDKFSFFFHLNFFWVISAFLWDEAGGIEMEFFLFNTPLVTNVAP